MKKTLLLLSAFLAIGTTQAQNQFSFGFDGTTADMEAAGWVRTNQSSPATATLWTNGTYTQHVVTTTAPYNSFGTVATAVGGTTNIPDGQSGGGNSFALVNYTSTGITSPITGAISGTGTISNWLITPTITVENGDVVSFYTRIGKITTTASPNANYADNLQLRMSANGDFTTNPTTGSADVGDFTTLLVDVNPSLNLTAFPTSWANGMKSATISGLTGPTAVKFAFRYFVTSGGPDGNNSDIIGIDTFSVDRTLATQDFFAANFAVYPNPASNVLSIDSKNSIEISQLQLTDINGRIVKEVKASGVSTQINIGELNAGVYFLKATSAQGVGTTKIVKN